MIKKCSKCDHPYPASFDEVVSVTVDTDGHREPAVTRPKEWKVIPGGPVVCPKCGEANTFNAPPPPAA